MSYDNNPNSQRGKTSEQELPKHLAMFALKAATSLKGELDLGVYNKKKQYFATWNEEQQEAFYCQYPGLKGLD